MRSILLLLLTVPAHTAPPDAAAARVAAASAAYEDALTRWKSGVVDLDTVYRWSIRWNDAAHDPHAHAARMAALATAVRAAVTAGSATQSDGKAIDYYLAEASVLNQR